MSAVFTARYHGNCEVCEVRVEPGDEVAFSEQSGFLVHELCEGSDQDRPRRGQHRVEQTFEPGDICPVCFIARAVNKTCGCSE